MKNPATRDRVATTGAPATRVPPGRGPLVLSALRRSGGGPVAAVAVLVVVLAGAVGIQLHRAATPAGDSPAAARPAPDPAAALDARIATLEARVQADPADAKGWQELGLAYQSKNLRGRELSFSAKAVEALARADQLRPGDPGIITSRALVQASRHDFAGARALVQPVVDDDPYAADARAVMVDACVELGLYDEAERYLDELGRLRPGQATLARMSYLRELHGDLTGALVAMRRAAATEPRDPWDQATLHTFTGDLLLLQGRAEGALAELDQALAAKPDLPGAVASKGKALTALGRYDEAVRGLEDYLRVHQDVAVASALAELRGLKGQPSPDLDPMIDRILADEAAAGYDNAFERADIDLGRGHVEAGRAHAELGYARRPDNVIATEVLAYARFLGGDIEGARGLVGPMTRLDSADLHQHVRAAEILHAAGDPDGARAQLRRAFELAPYPSPSVIAPARALAGELGVEPPAPWRPLV
jgi:tetratricopeptide (TPR) repeat protein